MTLPPIDTLVPYVVGGGSIGAGIWIAKLFGSGVAWTVTYFTDRYDKKEANLDAAEGLLDKRKDAMIDRLTADIRRLTERVDRHERELEECRKLHAEAEARALAYEALLQAKGEIKQQAQMLRAADKLAEKSEAKKAD